MRTKKVPRVGPLLQASTGFPSLIAEICDICLSAGRPLCQPEIYAHLSRPIDKNVFAVTIAQNLGTRLSRRRAGKRAREKYGVRTLYWVKGSKPRKHLWTEKEKQALRTLYPHIQSVDVARILGRDVGSVYRMAAQLCVRKSAEFNASPLNGRMHKGHGIERGAAHRFQKGIVPWNKGVHFVAGGRSAETRFKKGQLSKRWDPEIYSVGALRINTDGYIDMKMHDGYRPWRAFHVVLWEDANGRVPPDHIVVFKDGDKLNVCLENLECISRAANLRRNSVWVRYPRALAQSIHLLGQIKRRLRERSEQTA